MDEGSSGSRTAAEMHRSSAANPRAGRFNTRVLTVLAFSTQPITNPARPDKSSHDGRYFLFRPPVSNELSSGGYVKHGFPSKKPLAEYDFKFPKRIPKAAIVRLFDCDFIERHGCAVLIGPTGTGKTHLLTALGYTAVERGHSVCHTRVVDMINHLTAAQLNGSLGKTLGTYVRPSLSRERRHHLAGAVRARACNARSPMRNEKSPTTS